MNHHRTFSFWRAATECLLGSVVLALLTFVCFRSQVSSTTVALLYLIVIVLAVARGKAIVNGTTTIDIAPNPIVIARLSLTPNFQLGDDRPAEDR